MAEADEVERLLPVELLVAGLEIDLCVAARPRDGVDVAVIDLHVDAVHLVHEQLEAVEVDRDQVVHGDSGQLLDGVERAAHAAGRPGGVDAVGLDRGRRIAVDRHLEVAREREQRQRVRLRVGADEHDRVGARVLRAEAEGAGARVVADHERDGRLRRCRQLREVLLRSPDLLRVRRERIQRLVRIEIEPAREARDDDHEREQDPAEDLGGRAAGRRRRRRRWRRVAPHRLDDSGRQDGSAVAVHGRGATHSSLERRPHAKARLPRGRRRATIPQGPATPC